ncbi:MAG: hypothetical protein KAF91_09450 [Nostoc sp. TH1S01]|nr:hypothetical protein [Nostoc sp. TH1S01]
MDKFQGSIGEVLQGSLQIENLNTTERLEAVNDCIDFNFDIKILSISGQICKSGKLQIKGSVIGIQIGDTVVDLSKGEFCANPSIGFEEVKYCFYLSGSCLRTKGYVDGWFHSKQEWDEEIVCF